VFPKLGDQLFFSQCDVEQRGVRRIGHISHWAYSRLLWAAVAIALAGVGGCSSGGPQFELNMEGRDPDNLTTLMKNDVQGKLKQLFGTPDEPLVPAPADVVYDEQTGEKLIDLDRLKMAAGPVGSDAQGNQRGLYRQHCATCHGISGNGAGPTAEMLNPYPRDFRDGIFKYTSTAEGAKPTRADLKRTLLMGIPGTAMPSYAALRDEEVEALVDYVIYLSLRGETELWMLETFFTGAENPPLDMDAVLYDGLEPTVEFWLEAPGEVVPVDGLQDVEPDIALGRELYAGDKAECIKCHGEYGRGDGTETENYDYWNKRKLGVTPEETAAKARLFTLPIQKLQARNFAEGIFRGGSNPTDIYRRIHVGIKGTPMPAAGPWGKNAGALTKEEIWHVVHYILSLSQ